MVTKNAESETNIKETIGQIQEEENSIRKII